MGEKSVGGKKEMKWRQRRQRKDWRNVQKRKRRQMKRPLFKPPKSFSHTDILDMVIHRKKETGKSLKTTLTSHVQGIVVVISKSGRFLVSRFMKVDGETLSYCVIKKLVGLSRLKAFNMVPTMCSSPLSTDIFPFCSPSSSSSCA